MKPLHERGFAGMLPRTMSQGNDAFTPKDAEPAADAEGSASSSTSAESRSREGATSSEDRGSKDLAAAAKQKARAKPEVDEEDQDSEDSDEKDSDEKDSDEKDSDEKVSKPEPRERPRSSRRDGSSSRRARRDEDDDDERLVPPETEEAVNVPKMQTVYMLGAMSALTVVLWFAARLTCNVHPDQVREPKHFSTKDLAADPKNAAFEFQQRFEMGDFTTAYDLATGEMRRTVETKLKECEAAADECAKNEEKLAGTVNSTGRLLEQTPTRASVEIQTFYQSSTTPKTFAFDVLKEGAFWRVASRREVAEAPVQQAAAPTQQAVTPTPQNQASPVAPMESPDQAAPATPQ